MYARLRLVVLVVIALLSPSPGTAQEGGGVGNAQNGSTRSVTATGAGPRLDAIVTGYRVTEQRLDSTLSLQRRSSSTSKPVALMIVGGAAIVLGALIGDDVGLLFMIGGAVALLIGLYRYLS
jgi:hypothetical protein